jgi:hypothetical protein
VPQLKQAAQQLLAEMGASSGQVQDDYVAEMCRWAELFHCYDDDSNDTTAVVLAEERNAWRDSK